MSHTRSGRTAALAVTQLECRVNPHGGLAEATGPYALGSDAGEIGTAAVYNEDGTIQFEVTPYGEDFTGGVRVALADVTGDAVPDLITAPGPGIEPTVKVYDGATQTEIASFLAYEAEFTGGVYLAAADLTGDGMAEIVTGADQGGGPRVRVFDGASVAAGGAEPTARADFLAIEDENFRGGVRLALGDINGDDVADLLVGAGHGGGPRVAVFDGAQLAEGDVVKLFADFFAYEPGLRDGCNVAVGDVNGDGTGDLVFGAGPGGAPRVRVANGEVVLESGGGVNLDDLAGSELANFFAGDLSSREGVRVGAIPSDDGTDQVVALDVATDGVSVYGSDGEETDSAEDGAGFFGCYVDDNDNSDDSTDNSTDSSTNSSAALTATDDTTATVEDEFVPHGRHRRR